MGYYRNILNRFMILVAWNTAFSYNYEYKISIILGSINIRYFG